MSNSDQGVIRQSVVPEYGWDSAEQEPAHGYLIPTIEKALAGAAIKPGAGSVRLFDAGCGNGYIASHFRAKGFAVAGCDASPQGVEHAKKANPGARFEVCSVYDSLADKFGDGWDVVVSSEVIEHLYDPRCFVGRIRELLKPDGLLIVTTPYHGYLKNLALALTNNFDGHFTALWDGGHIKFWSYATLKSLLSEQGFTDFRFYGAGRAPWLWKSMVVSARKG